LVPKRDDLPGWSVLAVGTARPITDGDELARAERLPLSPWADGARDTFIRLVGARITGRELTFSVKT
jgi:uncharacterized protein